MHTRNFKGGGERERERNRLLGRRIERESLYNCENVEENSMDKKLLVIRPDLASKKETQKPLPGHSIPPLTTTTTHYNHHHHHQHHYNNMEDTSHTYSCSASTRGTHTHTHTHTHTQST